MNTVIWNALTQEAQTQILQRPAIQNHASIAEQVRDILFNIQEGGDRILKDLTHQFDQYTLNQIQISADEIKAASDRIAPELKAALDQAYENIYRFHHAQISPNLEIETLKGVSCELITRPIQRVGFYIPGGSAPLPSTALMLGIPAQISGCHQIVLCSPPPIADEILYIAQKCQIDAVYAIGGAQAIAAMAYGTESVIKVDKIFGPGNAYVTEAKRQVSADHLGAAIDMPAGPSEVLVIADETANADFIAADLLSQAEHGPDSQAILITPSAKLAQDVCSAIQEQLPQLSRVKTAETALLSSRIILAEDLAQCVEISNLYAPEHLIVQTENPRDLLSSLDNAGSIFLGAWSPESIGDYASGTNHVLPTYGFTRTYSSLGLADFNKRMTVQTLTPDGLQKLAPTVIAMADAEGLDAHRQAISIRVQKLNQKSRG